MKTDSVTKVIFQLIIYKVEFTVVPPTFAFCLARIKQCPISKSNITDHQQSVFIKPLEQTLNEWYFFIIRQMM